MSQDQAFLDAIIEDLGSDAPRLIYADWLEERGKTARAEFIRVQCELASTDFWDERWEDLSTESERMLSRHEKEWVDDLESWKSKFEFSRGFVDRAILSKSYLTGFGDRLFKSNPTLTSLKVKSAKGGSSSKFFKKDFLRQISTLNLAASWADPNFIESLCQAETFRQLENLNLYSNPLKMRGIRHVLRTDTLPNLKRLNMSNISLENFGGMPLLFGHEKIDQLEWLDVSGNWKDNSIPAINEISQSMSANRLRFFEFGDKSFGTTADYSNSLARFVDSPVFANIDQLFISVPLSNANLELICNHPGAANLKAIGLTGLSKDQFPILVNGTSIWNQLQFINIGNTHGPIPKTDSAIARFCGLKSLWLCSVNENKSFLDSITAKCLNTTGTMRPNRF